MATAPLSLLRKALPERPLPLGGPTPVAVPSTAPVSTLAQETSESLSTHGAVLESLPADSPLLPVGAALQSALSGLSPVALAIASPVLDDFRAKAAPPPAAPDPPLLPLIEYVGLLDAPRRQTLSQALSALISRELETALPALLSYQTLSEGVLRGYPALAQSLASIAYDLSQSRPASLTEIASDLEYGLPDLARLLRGSAARSTDHYRAAAAQMVASHSVLRDSALTSSSLETTLSSLLTQSLAVAQAAQAYNAGPVDPAALQASILRQAEAAVRPKVTAYLKGALSSLKGKHHTTPPSPAVGLASKAS